MWNTVPGFERRSGGQVDHHLHAERPLALVMAVGQAEGFVELPSDGAHRPIADDRQPGANVHARLAALIAEPDAAARRSSSISAAATGMPGQICTVPVAAISLADPLHELAERHHQAAVLVQERRDVGQFDAVIARNPERAKAPIGHAQRQRTTAGADRVEQINDLLGRDRRGHRDRGGIEIREGSANAAGARDHARDAEADIVGALVAEHLKRQFGRARGSSGNRRSPGRSRRRRYRLHR